MSSVSTVFNSPTQTHTHCLNETAPKDTMVQTPQDEVATQKPSPLLNQMQSFETRAMKVLGDLQSLQAHREAQTRQIENSLNQLLTKTDSRTEQLQQLRELLGRMEEGIARKIENPNPLNLMEKTKLAILLLAPSLLFALGNIFAGAANQPGAQFLAITAGTPQLVQLCWHGYKGGTASLRKFSESVPQQLIWIATAALWYGHTARMSDGFRKY